MKAKIIGVSLVGVVIAAVIAVIVFVEPIDVREPKIKDGFEGWNRSGPFAINKHEYKIGESIFIATDNLQPNDVGSMIFVLPNGTTPYITIPFDANIKTGFNQYFKPGVSKARNICSVDDLVGQWTVVFKGTDYPPIWFRIINETIPGEGTNYMRLC